MPQSETPGADPEAMTPEAFRTWRKELGLKQKEAAERLGLKKRMIQYYEKGRRDGKAVEIPLTVRLACYAVSLGAADFDGRAPIAFVPAAEDTPAPADLTDDAGVPAVEGPEAPETTGA
ncbi:helix-turn-helix domain-containing protein [Segnochrobactraceae bacterium EtOH-i3]